MGELIEVQPGVAALEGAVPTTEQAVLAVVLSVGPGAVASHRSAAYLWGVEIAAFADKTANEVANACVLAAYLGDGQGRAVHLMGPLAKNVLRIAPPLTMIFDPLVLVMAPKISLNPPESWKDGDGVGVKK